MVLSVEVRRGVGQVDGGVDDQAGLVVVDSVLERGVFDDGGRGRGVDQVGAHAPTVPSASDSGPGSCGVVDDAGLVVVFDVHGDRVAGGADPRCGGLDQEHGSTAGRAGAGGPGGGAGLAPAVRLEDVDDVGVGVLPSPVIVVIVPGVCSMVSWCAHILQPSL